MLIQIQKVSKSFGRKQVLHQVSFEMKKGKIYGLVGRNGAGKSTIMKILSGILQPDEGHIIRNVHLSKIGCMMEKPNLYMDLNAIENMEISRRMYGIKDRNCIDELLKCVGLVEEKNKKVYQYSMGMKMRLGIAKALIGEPEILLLDEPLNGLDPIGVDEILHLLKEMSHQKKITILISSHMLLELEQIVTDYLILEHGFLKGIITEPELSEMKNNGEDMKAVLLEKLRE